MCRQAQVIGLKKFYRPFAMILQLDRIREPTGINDVKSIYINGEPHFIASFGGTIRLYRGTSEVHCFTVPFCVFHIFPCQDGYFLIGRKRYMFFRGSKKVAEHVFDQEFNKIDKILALKSFIVILYDNKHYVIGKIKNMQIDLGETLDDGQFFTVLGSIGFDEKVVILAKTFTKTHVLIYTVDNGKLRVTKKEIQSGISIASHSKERVLIFDKEGMWIYNEKLVFLKEFANYKHRCTLFDAEDKRTLLFCNNNEVIAINEDISHSTLGMLDFAPSSVAKINGLYFCGSTLGACFISITDKVGVMEWIGDYIEAPNRCSALLQKLHSCGDALQMYDSNAEKDSIPKVVRLNTDIDAINYKISNICELQKGSRFLGYFKCEYFTIFSFEDFSIINNGRFEPIINASARYIITRKRILYFQSADNIIQFNIDSTHAKIYTKFAITYAFKKLYTFDFETHVIRAFSVLFDICDFILHDESIVCIDFDEKIHICNPKDFHEKPIGRQYISSDTLFSEQYECLGNEGNILCTSEYFSDCSSGYPSPILVANGKVFTLIKEKPYCLFNTESHIYNYSYFNNQLIVCCRNMFIFNCTTTKIAYCNFESTNTFVVGNDIFICLPSGVVEHFEMPVLKENLLGSKFRTFDPGIVVESTMDNKAVKYTLDGRTLDFSGYFENFSCVIRKHLMCVGLVSVTMKKNKIIFISTRKRRLKVRKAITIESIPLCACSYNNSICVVTSDNVMCIAIRYGKIKIVRKIENIYCPCKDVQFYSDGIVLVTTYDWFYLIVNLKMNIIKKIQTESFSIPFMINSINGHGSKNMLYYQGACIDCIEDIVYILSYDDTVLVLTETGSVLAVQVGESETSRFLYDSAPKIISNIVN